MSGIEKLRTILIDHSISNIKHLARIVEKTNLDVVATTQERDEIIPLIKEYAPNIVFLDISLIDNGHRDIIQTILDELNIPIIILSDSTVQQTAKTVFAITSGASDFILKEKLFDNSYELEVIKKIKSALRQLSDHDKIKMKSKQNVKKKTEQVRKKEYVSVEQAQKPKKQIGMNSKKRITTNSPVHTLIAIGTSTGGPRALQTVLRQIPKNFPVPILIVQHMPSGFTKSLAERLNELCKIHVKEAVDQERIKPGTAYIAPGNFHMTVNKQMEIEVFKGPERLGHRPSVNVLFESIAELEHIGKIAVVLTGMGKDGSVGIEKMKTADPDTTVIVESEKTAIIFGMPRAAIETGYVTQELKIEEIGQTLINYTMKRGK